MKYIKFILSVLVAIFFLGACSSSKRIVKETNAIFPFSSDSHFTGIMLYDPVKKDTLLSKNSEKYFTPASNTKIFTLYTALKLLPSDVPAFRYLVSGDTLYLQGTGDPSFFHPNFKDSLAYKYIKEFHHIAINLNNYYDDVYGPGWAWEDYDLSYAPERSSLPLYGNVVRLINSASPSVYPTYFQPRVISQFDKKSRSQYQNQFYINPAQKDTLYVPFITKDSVVLDLFENIFKRKIHLIDNFPKGSKKVFLGFSRDSLAKEMMQTSDNFLAEQFLIMGSSVLSDSLSSGNTIKYMLDTHLNDLEQPPRWVDGSGLSRYNLFSPASIVDVLNRMYKAYPEDRLFNYFAVGGKSGTIENWYGGEEEPYVYAKTGTLGNNHCLSGYLLTDSGKTLLFSIMNNHYRTPTTDIKKRMQDFLEFVKSHY